MWQFVFTYVAGGFASLQWVLPAPASSPHVCHRRQGGWPGIQRKPHIKSKLWWARKFAEIILSSFDLVLGDSFPAPPLHMAAWAHQAVATLTKVDHRWSKLTWILARSGFLSSKLGWNRAKDPSEKQAWWPPWCPWNQVQFESNQPLSTRILICLSLLQLLSCQICNRRCR